MKTTLLLLLLFVMPKAAYPKDKSNAGFSGTWVLQVKKSTFEDPHKPRACILRIRIRGSEFHLKQTCTFENGETDVTNVDLIIDSKGDLVERDASQIRRSQVFKYGDSLALFRTISPLDGSAEGIDGAIYTLAEKGEALTVEEKNQMIDGHVFDNVWYFKKK